MKVTKLEVGNLETNCYILEKDGNALIIDPGAEPVLIKDKLSNLKIVGILITHDHFDHVGALASFDAEVFNYQNLKPGNTKISNFSFEVINTPGHSYDSLTFYFKDSNAMFTGDFLFKGTIGRTDLQTGSMLEMRQSIAKIKTYNKDIVIYPGHGDVSTIDFELKTNYYLK